MSHRKNKSCTQAGNFLKRLWILSLMLFSSPDFTSIFLATSSHPLWLGLPQFLVLKCYQASKFWHGPFLSVYTQPSNLIQFHGFNHYRYADISSIYIFKQKFVPPQKKKILPQALDLYFQLPVWKFHWLCCRHLNLICLKLNPTNPSTKVYAMLFLSWLLEIPIIYNLGVFLDFTLFSYITPSASKFLFKPRMWPLSINPMATTPVQDTIFSHINSWTSS